MKNENVEENMRSILLIDPEFMRDIELSLDSMIDYAQNRLLNCNDPHIKKIIKSDIERAEQVMTDIARWFTDEQ